MRIFARLKVVVKKSQLLKYESRLRGVQVMAFAHQCYDIYSKCSMSAINLAYRRYNLFQGFAVSVPGHGCR
jgi:hypothetical protein